MKKGVEEALDINIGGTTPIRKDQLNIIDGILKEKNMGKRIKLRRTISKKLNRIHLFLEYNNNYHREKLYLDLFPYGTNTEVRETIKKAISLQEKYESLFLNNKDNFILRKDLISENFFDYATKYADTKREKNRITYINAISSFTKTIGKSCKICKVDQSLVDKWVENNSKLSRYSLKRYSVNLKTIFSKAIKDKLIEVNPFEDVRLSYPERKLEHLTIEEINTVMNTDYENVSVKNAFLFSCFTGLRLSEVLNIRWKDYDKH